MQIIGNFLSNLKIGFINTNNKSNWYLNVILFNAVFKLKSGYYLQ